MGRVTDLLSGSSDEEESKSCKRCNKMFKKYGGTVKQYYGYDICTKCQHKDSPLA